MRIVLKVSSSNQDWGGGCAFAVVELSEVLATLAQRRIAALREQKNVDPDIDEVYYWASCVECYFSLGPTSQASTSGWKAQASR